MFPLDETLKPSAPLLLNVLFTTNTFCEPLEMVAPFVPLVLATTFTKVTKPVEVIAKPIPSLFWEVTFVSVMFEPLKVAPL